MSRPTILASRRSGYEHELEMAGHSITVDEPADHGGTDSGPSPAVLLAGSLAACTAITIEMYADRKGWDVGELRVATETEGSLTKGDASYEVVVEMPEGLDEDQRERLLRIATKCPVHKTLAPAVSISVRAGKIP